MAGVGLEQRRTVIGPPRVRVDPGTLPPGPRMPPVLQAAMRVWRYAEFSDRNHERHGDTFSVRVGALPVGVLTRDREAIRRLFTGDPLIKRHGNDALTPFLGEQSVLVLEPAEHLARRKMLLPPFHGERVQSYARLMERLVGKALDQVPVGGVTRMQPVAQELTLDVILQAVLGLDDLATRQTLRRTFDAMITPLSNLAFFVPALARDEHGEGLSDDQLHDELVTLITAGHETTATAISWGLDLLTHNPTAMARAREGEDAYLDALVKEILRIRSPAPIAAGRYLSEPFSIGRWTIPAGVPVIVDAYGVHHDPSIYPEPHSFRPERFLTEQPDTYGFVPFGGGAHRCVGATLALLEIKIVLREILARFELGPGSAREARPVPRAVTLAPRGGARVRVLRERPASRADTWS
jgi:cytochrome P450